jgi:hypothetical protein
MPNSGHPWVQTTQVAVTVENVPITADPTKEEAWGGVGRYAGSASSYQTVVTATVDALKIVEQLEISFTGGVLAKTKWQVTISDKVFSTEQMIDAPLTLSFYDLHLGAGKTVLVECKSTDGSSISCDASITGKEVG